MQFLSRKGGGGAQSMKQTKNLLAYYIITSVEDFFSHYIVLIMTSLYI